jgi:plastocyanin domain-containing protein
MKTLNTWLIATGLVLLVGCDGAASSAEAAPAGDTAARTVSVTVDTEGFHPNQVSASKGDKLQLQFKRTSDETCAKEVVFPELDIKKPLPLNEVVSIDVPTTAARTIAFQCGMGMYKSKLVIK